MTFRIKETSVGGDLPVSSIREFFGLPGIRRSVLTGTENQPVTFWFDNTLVVVSETQRNVFVTQEKNGRTQVLAELLPGENYKTSITRPDKIRGSARLQVKNTTKKLQK